MTKAPHKNEATLAAAIEKPFFTGDRKDAIPYNPAAEMQVFARKNPDKLAIRSPRASLTYREFDTRSDEFAFTMQRAGITQGDKVVLMIKPSVDLYLMAFALLKMGAIPVVVDPGMGLKRMLKSYQSVRPEAFAGIPLAHIIRRFAKESFSSVKCKVWVKDGRITFPGDRGPSQTKGKDKAFPIAPTRWNDLGIINFTTGSTGPAKAVEATYGMVSATVTIIRENYGQTENDVDLATVPFFGLLSLVLGATVIIPDMNPAKPAEVDPKTIIDTINREKVTTMLGSPALLSRVGAYAKLHKLTLPTMRMVNSGGAPIGMENLRTFSELLTNGSMHSSWGATEGLPMATISASELLERLRPMIEAGHGTPVGRILPGIEMRLIHPHLDKVENWDDSLLVKPGEIGEIVVHGANVSRAYHWNPEANAAHKIIEKTFDDEANKIWHRTGDLGWLDKDKILFFTGRKAHSFEDARSVTLHSVSAEGVTNVHPSVRRSALVGVGNRAIMCIERNPNTSAKDEGRIREELLALMQKSAATETVKTVLFHRRFPVDLRHNAKIERPLLAKWAAHQLEEPSRLAAYTRLIPISGWIYLVVGLIFPLSGWWAAIWWIDLFLSVAVHIAQIPKGIAIGAIHGYTARESALRTFFWGATWWKPLEP